MQLHTLPVTDVDLVCQNILLDDSAQIIDYEWTFTFPVPLEFVIFRFLYFYLEAKNRTCYQQPALAGLYEKAGITKEMREKLSADGDRFSAVCAKWCTGTEKQL